MKRREFVASTAGAAGALLLGGCGERAADIPGGFVGSEPARGHALRDGMAEGGAAASPSRTRRVDVVIAGGGVAGLAAARALRLAGHDDFALLEMEDSAGGNSRAASVGGLACPLGAHYLPVPGDAAHEVQDLLEELGLRRRVSGRWTYDERHLCHSPQERLFFDGHWQEGLLPVQGVGTDTLAQYRRFAARVAQWQRDERFTIPTLRGGALTSGLLGLDAVSFESWLDAERLDDVHLRWYLEYACRDDYGAGSAQVSAWAGLHYFASRHGFHAPGSDDDERDAVLTWPEGNAWLAERLAAPLGDRLLRAHTVTRIEETRHGVEVDAWDAAGATQVRFQARRCIVALPVFVAARVVRNPPACLRQAAAALRHAPWLVANLHLSGPLEDAPGAAPSWDNVVYGSRGLGYVDAGHQRLDPTPAPTVLTWYRPLGPSRFDDAGARRLLLEAPWQHWRDQAIAELSQPHPDLAARTRRIDIARYGHAMAIPGPGVRRALQAAAGEALAMAGRLRFAHADWSGYSIFEEAFTRGHLAGVAAA
ncbi:MAG: FAD-binding protein [Comamonadaceae bacterium]|nr:MAG: FAD-binding protein [Comamonadaceae bacterium]